jgi:hypothetical protein
VVLLLQPAVGVVTAGQLATRLQQSVALLPEDPVDHRPASLDVGHRAAGAEDLLRNVLLPKTTGFP